MFLHHPIQSKAAVPTGLRSFTQQHTESNITLFCNIHKITIGRRENKESKREKRERGERGKRGGRKRNKEACAIEEESYSKGTWRRKSFYKINIFHNTFALLSINSAIFKKFYFFQGSRMPDEQPGTHFLHLLFPLPHP